MTDVFSKRASIRHYKKDEVPREKIDALLSAAVQAPSAGNRQPWHFYVVRSDEFKRKLSECAYGQAFIHSAPVVIVVCAVPALSASRYLERGENLYCIQDTAAAIENILLCAAMQGLGACWVGAFEEEKVRSALQLPAERRPIALLPIGYPKGLSIKPKRRPMKDIVTEMN